MPRTIKRQKIVRKWITKYKTNTLVKPQLGGHIPNEINPIIYDKEKRHEMINNLGRPMTKSSIFGIGKLPEITEEQMDKDINNLKSHMINMDDDEKYKLCAELILSLYDSIDVVPLPPTIHKHHKYTGWGSADLKSSHKFIYFVSTYCVGVIKRYQELAKSHRLDKRMSANSLAASAKGISVASDSYSSSKPKVNGIETLVLSNDRAVIAKTTPYMAQLQGESGIKTAPSGFLSGFNKKKMLEILEKLGYSKADIKEISDRIQNRIEILPPGIYSYTIISNGAEILIVAVNNMDQSKYLLSRYLYKVELTPEETGEFYLYAMEPYSAPPKVMPFKLSIYEEISYKEISGKKGTNYNRLSAANINNTSDLRFVTDINKTSERKFATNMQSAREKAKDSILTQKSNKLIFSESTSNCSEFKDKMECMKNQKCEYTRKTKKCRTKREYLQGLEDIS
jgi:hypothetical protein